MFVLRVFFFSVGGFFFVKSRNVTAVLEFGDFLGFLVFFRPPINTLRSVR